MNENPTILPGGAASNSSVQQGATGWAIGRGPKDPRGDGELRGEAEDLAGLPRGSLSTIRFGFPDAFVPGDVEWGRVDFEELEAEERYQFIHAPEAVAQFLVGKHLEVVMTFLSWGFELAELERHHPLPRPTFELRRAKGSVIYVLDRSDQSASSTEERAQAIVADVRRLSNRRRGRYRRCRVCDEMTEPGGMQSIDVCKSCAPEHFGLVY